MVLHMMRAGFYEQRLLGLRTTASRQKITLRVKGAVEHFLRGCSL
jgi:hypothetical protein